MMAASTPGAPRLQPGTGHRSPWRIAPVAILLCSILFIAPEARFNIGDLALPHYRITVMIMLAWVAPRLLNGSIRYHWPDLFILLAILWSLMAFLAFYGFAEGVVRGAAVAIDTGGAYIVARASIRSTDDLRRLLIIIAPFLLFAGLLMAVESLTRQPIWRPLFTSIFGPLQIFTEGRASGTLGFSPEIRMGLQRAYGPFSHPILAGSILVSPLPLYLMSGIRSWPRYFGLLAAPMAIFSVSSAALLSLIIAFGTTIIDRLLRFFRKITWPMIASFIALAALIVQLGSQSGLINVVSRVTLTPHTAFYRQLIWEYGWQSMLAHPWIGIGYTEYERPPWMSSSIDAHFLALGVRSGFPATTLLLLGIIAIIFILGRKSHVGTRHDRNCLIGMNISLTILVLSSMTVTYFSEANLWFMAFVGIAASLSAPAQLQSGPDLSPPQDFRAPAASLAARSDPEKS